MSSLDECTDRAKLEVDWEDAAWKEGRLHMAHHQSARAGALRCQTFKYSNQVPEVLQRNRIIGTSDYINWMPPDRCLIEQVGQEETQDS